MKRLLSPGVESVFAHLTIERQAEVGVPTEVHTNLPLQGLSKAGIEDPPHNTGSHYRYDNAVAALVIVEVLKRAVGSTAKQVARAIREAGVDISDAQVMNFFNGRFRPSHATVNRVAAALNLPELRVVAEWPWRLLAAQSIEVSDIERVCMPQLAALVEVTNEPSPVNDAPGVPRWYTPKQFEPPACDMYEPGKPPAFWQRLAQLRVAMAQGDVHSINVYLAEAIQWLPSLITHPAARPHMEEIFACMRVLMRTIDPRFLWFSVDWDAIDYRVRTSTYGLDLAPITFTRAQLAWLRRHHRYTTEPGKVFKNIFMGNQPSAGRNRRIARGISSGAIRGLPP